jgi:CubicO group peptidase (beta-lactamase class C family)
VVPNWHLSALAGAGVLLSTVDDMMKFVAAALRPDTTTVLGRAIARTEQGRLTAGSPNMSIALAWHVLRRPDREILWHNGGTGGYRTIIAFDPVARVGVVVLSNTNVGVDEIGLHLIDPAFPLPLIQEQQRRVGVGARHIPATATARPLTLR